MSNGDIQLSPHFWLSEFTDSQTAARKGIDNTPSVEIVSELKRTAMCMEFVRTLLNAPISVSSGYRSRALNRAVGGMYNSQHITGQAVDFTCRQFGSVRDVYNAIKSSGIHYDQLIIEFGQWVHISFSPSPRHQAFEMS